MEDFFDKVFGKQVTLQNECNNGRFKKDDIIKVYGHATAAIIELCEMLQCDTRWKKSITGAKKSPVTNDDDFKEEWADAFIYLINVAIYKGLTIDDLKTAITTKQEINFARMHGHRGGVDTNA